MKVALGPQPHSLTGALHTVSGLTDNQILRATGAGTFGFETASDIPEIVARVTADVDVANTVGETDLFRSAFTWTKMRDPSTYNRMLRLTLAGDMLYNNNVADTLQFNLGVDTQTLIASALVPAGALSATRRAWRMVFEIMMRGGSNAAQGVFEMLVSTPASPGVGTGAFIVGNSDVSRLSSRIVTAGLSTMAEVFVSAIWSAASANNSFRMRSGQLELI